MRQRGKSGSEFRGEPFNAPEIFEIEGRTFRVRTCNQVERRSLELMVRRLIPSPLAKLKAEAARFDPETAARIMEAGAKDARRQTLAHWPPDLGSRAWFDAVLDHAEAYARALWLALRSDPDAKDVELSDCRRMIDDALGDSAAQLEILRALSRFACGEPRDDDDEAEAEALALGGSAPAKSLRVRSETDLASDRHIAKAKLRKLFRDMVRELPWASPTAVAELSDDQLLFYLSAGGPDSRRMQPGASPMEFFREPGSDGSSPWLPRSPVAGSIVERLYDRDKPERLKRR